MTGVVSLGVWLTGRKAGPQRGWGEGWVRPVEMSFNLGEVGRVETREGDEKEAVVREIQERVATASGEYALYVYRLKEGRGYGFNERERMPGASIMKVPAMVAALRKVEMGSWKAEEEFELREADRMPGSGPLQFELAGTKVTIERLIREMGKQSDNTAWVMMNRLVGYRGVEEVMLALGMGESDYRGLTTTAVDVAKMWAKLYEGGVLGKGLWERLAADLMDSIYEDRIPVGIGGEGVRVVHKVGTLGDVWADAGVVEMEGREPVVVVILNKGVEREEARELVVWMAGRVWELEKKYN